MVQEATGIIYHNAVEEVAAEDIQKLKELVLLKIQNILLLLVPEVQVLQIIF